MKRQVYQNINREDQKTAAQARIEDIVMPVFDGTNCSSWKFRLLTLLEYKDCTEPAVRDRGDGEREETAASWKKMNLKTKTILISTI